VKDGNVITGGGVTAGIDFGLSVIAEIAGETTAKKIQLGIEYDPAQRSDRIAILFAALHESAFGP
jgi:cyclohexyl-isocyanide hydratase